MTEPTPSEACTRPAIPACPASVASTVVPVWMDPNTTPMSSCATSSTTKVAVTSRAPVTTAARCAWASRAVGCRANAHPNTSRMLAATTIASWGLATTTIRPSRAGPSTNDASSAAPS